MGCSSSDCNIRACLPAPPPRRCAAAGRPAQAAPASCWSRSRRWGTPLPGTACGRGKEAGASQQRVGEQQATQRAGQTHHASRAGSCRISKGDYDWLLPVGVPRENTHWLFWVRRSTRRGGSRRRRSAASHSRRASIAASSSPASESSLSASSRSAADGGGGVGGAGMCAGGPARQEGVRNKSMWQQHDSSVIHFSSN